MQEYQFRVIETRTYEMIYTVEADSAEEALDFAHDGETVEEQEIKLKDVIDRVVYDEVKNG